MYAAFICYHLAQLSLGKSVLCCVRSALQMFPACSLPGLRSLKFFPRFHWFLYIPMVQLFIAMPSWQLISLRLFPAIIVSWLYLLVVPYTTWLFSNMIVLSHFCSLPCMNVSYGGWFQPWLFPAMIASCHDCFLPWLFPAMIVSCHDCFLPWLFPAMIVPSFDCFLLRFSLLRFCFNLFYAMILLAFLIVTRFCYFLQQQFLCTLVWVVSFYFYSLVKFLPYDCYFTMLHFFLALFVSSYLFMILFFHCWLIWMFSLFL